MTTISKVITNRASLKWLTKAVLVLALITSSGYTPEYRIHRNEPAKTEISGARRVSSKKVVYFKKTSDLPNGLFSSTSEVNKFCLDFFYQKALISAKLKSNHQAHPNKDQYKTFLLFHA